MREGRIQTLRAQISKFDTSFKTLAGARSASKEPEEEDLRDHYREALEKNIVEKGDVIIKLREKLYTQLGDHNEKQERMIDLESMFKSRAKEFALTEEIIKDEINEIKE